MNKKKIILIDMIAIIAMLFPCAAANATPKYLSVPVYKQEKTNWCWAATTRSISVYLGGSKASQCQFVKWGKASSACNNVTGTFDTDTERALKAAGITNTGKTVNSALSEAQLATQLLANKPVIIRWSYANKAVGHRLIIRGYTADPGYMVLSYIDPEHTSYRSGTYAWVKSSGHTWAASRYGMKK